MTRGLKFLFILCFAVFVLLFVFYVLLFALVSPEILEKRMTSVIEQKTEGVFFYEGFDVKYFPTLKVSYSDIRLNTSSGRMALKAEQMDLTMRALAVLFKRAEPSRFELRQADIEFTTPDSELFRDIRLSGVSMRLKSGRGLGSKKKIEFEGGLQGVPKAIRGNVEILGNIGPGWEWKNIGLRGNLSFATLDYQTFNDLIELPKALSVRGGALDLDVTLNKTQGENMVLISSVSDVENLSYGYVEDNRDLTSTPMNVHAELETAWNPLTEDLIFQRSNIVLPRGHLGIYGHVSLSTGEIQELRLSGENLLLEQIPQYGIMMKDKLPYNVGFSGPSRWDVVLQGTWDHLSVDANIDLSQAILTYARYFSKPKGVPLTLDLDVLVKKGSLVEGDFSFRLEGAILKGTIAGIDLASGEAQINIITNKFPLEPWNSIIVPLNDFKAEGIIKLLGNFKGNLYDGSPGERILNVTLEHGTLTSPRGVQVKNLGLLLDFGKMAFDIKKASFEIGESQVDAEFMVYNFFEKPVLEGTVRSEYLEPTVLLRSIEDFMPSLTERVGEIWESLRTWTSRAFPEKTHARNLKVSVRYADDILNVKEFEIDAYGGKAKLLGKFDYHSPVPGYEIDMDISDWQIQNFAKDPDTGDVFAEGKMFGKINLVYDAAKAADALKGSGSLLFTKGALRTFDLLAAVSYISEFSHLNQDAGGITFFDDLQMDFTLKDDKFIAEKMTLISSDMVAEISGDALLDGILNFRVGVYLSEENTEKVLESFDFKSSSYYGRLGPIPFILSGPITKPGLATDSEPLASLIRNLGDKKAHKVLRNFLPEETLFRRDVGGVS